MCTGTCTMCLSTDAKEYARDAREILIRHLIHLINLKTRHKLIALTTPRGPIPLIKKDAAVIRTEPLKSNTAICRESASCRTPMDAVTELGSQNKKTWSRQLFSSSVTFSSLKTKLSIDREPAHIKSHRYLPSQGDAIDVQQCTNTLPSPTDMWFRRKGGSTPVPISSLRENVAGGGG